MDDPDDFWTSARIDDGSLSAETEIIRPALNFEVIDNVLPLDAQLGAYPKRVFPEALAAFLFSDNSNAAPFAILDATHIQGLPEMLDASGLEHRCLFLSEDGDTTPESAPWLVRLDATANFTRNVFTTGPAPWHLWTSDPGLILLSKLHFQDLWRHLRKFTRVSEPSGRRHFFRHWNHHVFLAWMTESRDHPDRCHAYFGALGKPAVDAVLARGAPGDMVLHVSPDTEVMAQIDPRPFRITGPADPILRRGMVRPLANILVRQLRIDHPAIVAKYQPLALEFAIEDTLMRLHGYGFRRHDILTELVVQDLYLGHPFENEDTAGHMLAVCRSDTPQEARYAELCGMIVALADQENQGKIHR